MFVGDDVGDYDGVDFWESDIYSELDRQNAVDTIYGVINYDWEFPFTDVKISYMWDDFSKDNLNYCKEMSDANNLNAWDECIVFTSSFHTPKDSLVLESDSDISDYTWYLGRAKGWEWKILTNWFN